MFCRESGPAVPGVGAQRAGRGAGVPEHGRPLHQHVPSGDAPAIFHRGRPPVSAAPRLTSSTPDIT